MCTARLPVFTKRINVRGRQSELHGSQCKPPGIRRKTQRSRAAFTYTTQHGQEMSPIIENVHPAENEFISANFQIYNRKRSSFLNSFRAPQGA